MTVLIINANKNIITGFLPKVKFEESTKNTSTFSLSEKAFIKLRSRVRERGINPYALMSW